MLRLSRLVVRSRSPRQFVLAIHGTIHRGGCRGTPVISRKELEHLAKVHGSERCDRVNEPLWSLSQTLYNETTSLGRKLHCWLCRNEERRDAHDVTTRSSAYRQTW